MDERVNDVADDMYTSNVLCPSLYINSMSMTSYHEKEPDLKDKKYVAWKTESECDCSKLMQSEEIQPRTRRCTQQMSQRQLANDGVKRSLHLHRRRFQLQAKRGRRARQSRGRRKWGSWPCLQCLVCRMKSCCVCVEEVVAGRSLPTLRSGTQGDTCPVTGPIIAEKDGARRGLRN